MSAVLPNLETMTREQMLQAMEELWAALSKDEDALVTPEWHRTALQETAARFHAGAEVPIPWEQAKQDLISSRRKK